MRNLLHPTLLAAALLAPALPGWAAGLLNDTGAVLCRAADGSFSADCAGTGQDGDHGRDVAFPNPRNGKAGFAFVKLSETGAELPASATDWRCVKDKVSGLVWEVKTADGGLHDKARVYTLGWSRGPGDAVTFIDTVNAEGLCGANDWRLPLVHELQGLLDYGKEEGPARIDEAWFPNTAADSFWTSMLQPGQSGRALNVDFLNGTERDDFRWQEMQVRLVRGAAPPIARFVARGDEVLDRATRLVWKRCSEGQSWNGSACTGTAGNWSWQAALDRAHDVAGATGVAWRVPNVKELASIILRERRLFDDAIDPRFFPNTPMDRNYWSATPRAGEATESYTVAFTIGGVFWAEGEFAQHLRLVREAQ